MVAWLLWLIVTGGGKEVRRPRAGGGGADRDDLPPIPEDAEAGALAEEELFDTDDLDLPPPPPPSFQSDTDGGTGSGGNVDPWAEADELYQQRVSSEGQRGPSSRRTSRMARAAVSSSGRQMVYLKPKSYPAHRANFRIEVRGIKFFVAVCMSFMCQVKEYDLFSLLYSII